MFYFRSVSIYQKSLKGGRSLCTHGRPVIAEVISASNVWAHKDTVRAVYNQSDDWPLECDAACKSAAGHKLNVICIHSSDSHAKSTQFSG